ncbi:MAG: ProQ/FINO family protein [Pseudomonadota bacterium]
MTDTIQDAPVQAVQPVEPTPPSAPAKKQGRASNVQPVLEKLFELYPHLFGAEFLPLKLGIFQELLAAHPDVFERDSLKVALGLHTRSGRYLHSVASGQPRHDLQGAAVEDVAPEHIYLAMLELFRRRQARSQEDLRPKFRAQLIAAFEASGLTRQEYLTRVQTNNVDASTLLEEALAEYEQKMAKQEALLRAFESSGKSPAEFADMYGMDPRDVTRALERKQRLQAA